MLNICYCGSMAGYPHKADCPYPLFRGSQEQEDAWYEAREAKLSVKYVRLTVDKRYPAGWVFDFPPILAGSIVPVVPATNLPDNEGRCWINTPELEDDAYGILLEPDEYEEVEDG